MSGNHLFEEKTYAARRKRLQQAIPSGIILLMGNEESPCNYADNVYPFRQDSNFLYFLGIDKPGLAAIIDIDAGKTILFGDDPDIMHIVWMGALPSMAELAAAAGGADTASYAQIESYLAEARSKGRFIHYLPPYRADNSIKLSRWLGISLDGLAAGASVPLIEAVVAQRSCKSDEEIAEMEKAVNTSGLMHLAAMKAARAGRKEYELVGLVESIARAGGGGLPYTVILSVNGQILHNHYYGNTLQSGQLVLGDFGADTAMHYAGDITRTFPVDQKFTARQKEIYQIVLDTEVAAIQSLKPGVRYLDVHLAASRHIAEGLKSLGLMKGDLDEAVAAGAHALFFPHGLGHMIGLDVHDMEDLGENYVGYGNELIRSTQFGLRSLRLARTLEPGFVLTVEPGIYFIPELINLWRKENLHTEFINYDKLEAYFDFGGIRIEDNVLITTEGHRVLGNPIPKTLAEVEALRIG
ncbi:MAG: aminopeptidase P family protein [Saprospiraceae bacterium]|nr:aminopeptidase P family protein [Saprospiraceae bacterium]MDZ4703338.1 aminopeptidase P family protein [Saprospiraceae bacterium]